MYVDLPVSRWTILHSLKGLLRNSWTKKVPWNVGMTMDRSDFWKSCHEGAQASWRKRDSWQPSRLPHLPKDYIYAPRYVVSSSRRNIGSLMLSYVVTFGINLGNNCQRRWIMCTSYRPLIRGFDLAPFCAEFHQEAFHQLDVMQSDLHILLLRYVVDSTWIAQTIVFGGQMVQKSVFFPFWRSGSSTRAQGLVDLGESTESESTQQPAPPPPTALLRAPATYFNWIAFGYSQQRLKRLLYVENCSSPT